MQFTFFEDGDKSMVLSLVGIKHIILKQGYSNNLSAVRDVLFEFHLKFWNTANIGIPASS